MARAPGFRHVLLVPPETKPATCISHCSARRRVRRPTFLRRRLHLPGVRNAGTGAEYGPDATLDYAEVRVRLAPTARAPAIERQHVPRT